MGTPSTTKHACLGIECSLLKLNFYLKSWQMNDAPKEFVECTYYDYGYTILIIIFVYKYTLYILRISPIDYGKDEHVSNSILSHVYESLSLLICLFFLFKKEMWSLNLSFNEKYQEKLIKFKLLFLNFNPFN